MSVRKRKTVKVPQWAKDAIWYQIFPERFRNGSRRNDPKLSDITDRKIKGWRISSWGMDWYSQEKWEKPLGDFFKSVYYRRYGGDLIGVREKLDYLQDLGVNAIYLNPVFWAPSLHKYDASSLHHIDPSFGPDREGDLRRIAAARETEDPATWIWTAADRYFVELVAEVHRRRMKIILDGVFNHTGRMFFAFQDLLKRGRKSRYRDWYKIKKWNDDRTFDYEGWFGHQQLPEFRQVKDNLAPPVREYIFNITRRWMDPDGDGDPSDGIDGWRLDVAFCVPHGFWKQWRRHVKQINPEAYTTAEIVARADEYLRGDEFDAVMNYMWLYPTVSFFSPCPKPIAASVLRRRLDALRRAYPEQINYAVQNLLDSHDVGRISTMIENAYGPVDRFQHYFEFSRVRHQPGLVTTRPGRASWDVVRQMIVFQMTYLGAPMLYYGTEVGMWGANDPDDRQPMLWADIHYEKETHTLAGRCKASVRKPDFDLYRFVRRAVALRTTHEVLRRGKLRWVQTGDDRLAGFIRFDAERRILILLNASDEAKRYVLKQSARDLWEGGAVAPGRISVAPRGWRILDLSSPSARRIH